MAQTDPSITRILTSQSRDLGGFTVRRVLPQAALRHVGPFVFVDEMGPVRLPAGQGMDVRPHPHIGLATVTWLFDGQITHRDSLGTHIDIHPGEVNWMTAGRGIVHSERSPASERAKGPSLHGVQVWVALPDDAEEAAPSFHHAAADALPRFALGRVGATLIVGDAYDHSSPVPTFSPMFYVAITAPDGGGFRLPAEHVERGAFVIDGALTCGNTVISPGTLAVFAPGSDPLLTVSPGSRVMLLGGASVGPRYMAWNFVSSRKERLEQAKHDWANGGFPLVPGDEHERVEQP